MVYHENWFNLIKDEQNKGTNYLEIGNTVSME